MYLIDENVYLGSIDDAKNASLLQQAGITSLLTIDVEELPIDIVKKYDTKFIELEDTETANLLDLLDGGLEFVNKKCESGKVLVHCHAGVSRSVSFVCAWLMRKHEITLLEAEELVRKVKSDIKINQGFIHQLLIFESMRCVIDRDHPGYKAHRFRVLQHEVEATGHAQLSAQYLAKNPSLSSTLPSNCIFKCRRCRKPVFEQRNIYPHEIDESKAFNTRTVTVISNTNVSKCSSYFLEPIKWMEGSIISNLTGKLDCPYCSYKLGRFNWSGAQCSCGKWVTPALQVHSSNVDKVTSPLR